MRLMDCFVLCMISSVIAGITIVEKNLEDVLKFILQIYGIVLYEIAILLTHFMKEYFNSFDDIQFFHTFSSISRDM